MGQEIKIYNNIVWKLFFESCAAKLSPVCFISLWSNFNRDNYSLTLPGVSQSAGSFYSGVGGFGKSCCVIQTREVAFMQRGAGTVEFGAGLSLVYHPRADTLCFTMPVYTVKDAGKCLSCPVTLFIVDQPSGTSFSRALTRVVRLASALLSLVIGRLHWRQRWQRAAKCRIFGGC